MIGFIWLDAELIPIKINNHKKFQKSTVINLLFQLLFDILTEQQNFLAQFFLTSMLMLQILHFYFFSSQRLEIISTIFLLLVINS